MNFEGRSEWKNGRGRRLHPIDRLTYSKIKPILDRQSINRPYVHFWLLLHIVPYVLLNMFMSHSNITPPMNSLRFLSSEMNRPPCIPFFLLILWNTLFFSRFAIQFLTWLKIQLFRTSHSRTVRWSQINLLAYESSTFSHIFVRSFLNIITAPIIGTHVYLYCCWLWRWFLLHFGLLRLWYWTRYSPDPSAYRTAHVILKI